ncbi:MAG: MFS transporter [Gordonia sp. (in: high G+C Gram-positive bacteria)]
MALAEQSATPLRPGRALALAGVVFVALNLRTSVTGLSPIYRLISDDVPLSVPVISAIGILPPTAFAISGLLAPRIEARIGLESSLAVSLAVATLGHLLRALAQDAWVLIGGTAIGLLGLGIGNVLLPPVVKRYFPHHQGLVTSLYAALIAISTAVPPLVAGPVAGEAGWRISLGMWALLSIVAMLPWIRLVPLGRRAGAGEYAQFPHVDGTYLGLAWRAPVTWALAAVFSVSAMSGYALFAWLPKLLTDTAGVSAATAGNLLSLYAIMGLPLAVAVPAWTERVRNPLWLMIVGIAALIVGDLGLLLIPATGTWVWVTIAGLGLLLFPVCLALINLRSATERGSAALSGVSQGVGYVLGAVGAVVFGLLHNATGEWKAPMLFLTATAVMGIGAALVAARSGVIEDSAAARAGRRVPRGIDHHSSPHPIGCENQIVGQNSVDKENP